MADHEIVQIDISFILIAAPAAYRLMWLDAARRPEKDVNKWILSSQLDTAPMCGGDSFAMKLPKETSAVIPND